MNDVQLNVWNIQEQLLKSRVIKCYGEVNAKMAYEVNSCLDVLSNDDPSAPIKLEINTGGGDVLAGLSICDKIKTIPNPVIAINYGLCMSMGTVISSSCDVALSGENCQFMIHEVSSGCQGKLRDQKNEVEFSERLNKRCFNILTAKTKKTYDQLMSDAVRELYLNADEAKEYGLIDGILNPAKKELSGVKDFVTSLCKNEN